MGVHWSDNHTEDTKRVYSWKRDLTDKRDYYHCFKDTVKQDLPECLDLRDKCPSIYNQGYLGSCTANALATAYTFSEKQHNVECNDIINPSRLFLYYNERKQGGLTDNDSGTMIRNGMKSLKLNGVCDENIWPYNISNLNNEPKSKCYQEAKHHRAIIYKRVQQSLTSMKACLSKGIPFVFGFTVYESFETKEVEQTGIMSIPNINEEVLGGHVVMAVGYCDKKRCFIIRNSWGEEWGEGGYFYMPYKFIRDSTYCSDFWTLNKVNDSIDGEKGGVINIEYPKKKISNDTSSELVEDDIPED